MEIINYVKLAFLICSPRWDQRFYVTCKQLIVLKMNNYGYDEQNWTEKRKNINKQVLWMKWEKIEKKCWLSRCDKGARILLKQASTNSLILSSFFHFLKILCRKLDRIFCYFRFIDEAIFFQTKPTSNPLSKQIAELNAKNFEFATLASGHKRIFEELFHFGIVTQSEDRPFTVKLMLNMVVRWISFLLIRFSEKG